MQEYSIQRSQRRCHRTERTFAPGERYYSAVVARGRDVTRMDYASDAWDGPPEGAIGWWACQMPVKVQGTMKPAPASVLIAALETLLDDPSRGELTYLLALLLVRRRILSESSEAFAEASDQEFPSDGWLRLTHASTQREFVIPICEPPLDESPFYHEELTRLLFCEA